MPEKRPVRVRDLATLAYLGEPSLSPDGERLAFVWRTADGSRYRSRVAVAEASGRVRDWTRGERDGSPRWSPDGRLLSFVRAEDGISQIWVLSTEGGEASPLSKLPEGSIGEYRWSPDGKWIALTFRERALERTQAAEKEREANKASSPPWVLDDVQYRLDGDGVYGADRYRLLLMDAESGETRVLCASAPDGDYAFDWAPDSGRLAVVHTVRPRPYFDLPQDEVFLVDLGGLATVVPCSLEGRKGAPCWSPDGQWIAFLANTDPHDAWGTRSLRLYAIRPDGAEVRWVSEGYDDDFGVSTLSDTGSEAFGGLHWIGERIVGQVGYRGSSHPVAYRLDGTREVLSNGPGICLLGPQASANGELPVLLGGPTSPLEAGVVTLGQPPTPWTSVNREWAESLDLIAPEELQIPSSPNKDGSECVLHAWVIRPRVPNGAAVIQVHGGPHTQYGHALFHEFQCLAAAGYTVYFSNPRGSKGYGERHCREIFGDWGNQDWRDIEALTGFVQADPSVDSGRIAVAGGSYGGYMVNWAVGHSKAYRTAITDRCVSNLVSASGNADFPFNRDRYFTGYAFGSLESIAELWRQSPIAYFDQVDTPMLIIHSEGDLRCNIEQSEQVFAALQERGIKSRFVRYPRTTSHGMSRNGPPDLRQHRLEQMLLWLSETL